MRKLLLLAAAFFALGANAQQTWDFSVVPTQTLDDTGNLKCNLSTNGVMDTNPDNWCTFYNTSPVLDGQGLYVKKGEEFELTKGITFDLLGSDKMIMFRNYPTAYGGMHLYINKALVMYLPIKAGSKVTFTITSTKTRTLTFEGVTQDVPSSSSGETYGTLTYDVTEDNPPVEFLRNNYFIKSITVEEGGTADGITEVLQSVKQDGRMYNIAGQRLSKPIKGQIYIINGRKYVAR